MGLSEARILRHTLPSGLFHLHSILLLFRLSPATPIPCEARTPASGRGLSGEHGVMDEAGTSRSGGSAGRGGRSFPPARSGVFYKFTQQDLPAWKPAMTPGCVITIFLIIGITFVPVGLVCLQTSNSVEEIVHRYDIDCIPNAYRGNKQAYIKDSSISKKCIQKVQVQYHMKAPIYVYYELDNFYQNHRRYIKSRSDKQLRYGLKYTESSCSPIEKNNGLPIVPCGLIAWSLFNDTYDFARGSMKIMVDRKNISWRSDREHKFGKDVYPFNFQNGSLIGGGKLDPDIPLSNQEDLIVWMRTAALPRFRKLYGVIEEDLQADETITMHITNNYNTYTFGGKKSLVLTTTTWLGGKNDFLGYAYLITGSLGIFLSILVALIHVKVPRPHGDAAYVSWSRSNS